MMIITVTHATVSLECHTEIPLNSSGPKKPNFSED